MAVKLAAVVFAIYAPIALWLQHSYEPPFQPEGRIVVHLAAIQTAPLGGFAYASRPYALRNFEEYMGIDRKSPVLLYENDRLLGPAHSWHTDISNIGLGRYVHWNGTGIIFSSSDNSDPRTNGRHYWAVWK